MMPMHAHLAQFFQPHLLTALPKESVEELTEHERGAMAFFLRCPYRMDRESPGMVIFAPHGLAKVGNQWVLGIPAGRLSGENSG